MATDFWSSSHYKRWIVDRATLKQARADDLQYVDEPEHLDFLAIYFANAISKLGKKLQLRQRVIATATVFFRRFYLKNSYCETDPFIVIAACCYVAAKAEESPVHIKNVVTESRALFNQENYNVHNFPSDNSKLAEMEFYLVDELKCDLTVFQPYRTLLTLCKSAGDASVASSEAQEAEAGELGVGVGAADSPKYWGTGEGQLELPDGALQTAWFIINDTYRSELCLLYPPHLIAVTAIYLAFILHPTMRKTIVAQLPSESETHSQPESQAEHSAPTPTPQPRRSSRQAHHAAAAAAAESSKKPQDPITFLAELNVSLPLIATIAQEIISLYTLWDRYKEDATPDATKASRDQASSPFASSGSGIGNGGGGGGTNGDGNGNGSGSGSRCPSKRSAHTASRSSSLNTNTNTNSNSNSSTPLEVKDDSGSVDAGWSDENIVTPMFLSTLLTRIREARLVDLAHPASGRPVAINKVLERTQAAG